MSSVRFQRAYSLIISLVSFSIKLRMFLSNILLMMALHIAIVMKYIMCFAAVVIVSMRDDTTSVYEYVDYVVTFKIGVFLFRLLFP